MSGIPSLYRTLNVLSPRWKAKPWPHASKSYDTHALHPINTQRNYCPTLRPTTSSVAPFGCHLYPSSSSPSNAPLLFFQEWKWISRALSAGGGRWWTYCASKKKSCFSPLHAFPCEQKKATGSALVSSIWCIAKSRMKRHQRNSKSFTSRTFAKKDSVLNLRNPFVPLTHPPLMEQERPIHCGSVRSQISCTASVDLFGVISWRLSKMWETLSNSEFQISTPGAEWEFREREREEESRQMLTRLQ